MAEEQTEWSEEVVQAMTHRALLAFNKMNDQERKEFTDWLRQSNTGRPMLEWPKWPEVFRRISQ